MRIPLAAVLLVTLAAGCKPLLDGDRAGSTPLPTLPGTIPAPMASAIEAATVTASGLSESEPVLQTAVAVDLAAYCANQPCPAGASGSGWIVVFTVTNLEEDWLGQRVRLEVVLGADGKVIATNF